MIAAYFRFGICALFVCLGLFMISSAVFGVYRLHFALNRMHAAALGDTLGLLCIVIGLMAASGEGMTILKLLLIVIFMWCTSPISSHLISELECCTDEHLKHYCQLPENIDLTRPPE